MNTDETSVPPQPPLESRKVPPEGSGLYFLRNFLSRADDPDVTQLNDTELAKKIAQRAFERAEIKQVIKEAITEWIECKWEKAGRSMIEGALLVMFVAVILSMLWVGGVRK